MTALENILCLDLGGTGTRAALYTIDGREAQRTDASAGALSLGIDVTEAIVRTVAAELGISPETTRLVMGLAGAGLSHARSQLQKRLSDFQGNQIVGDGYAALLSATGGSPGALIAVGTGVTALALDAAGRTRALSGWGFPAGDIGGGAWIGLQVLKGHMRHADGLDRDYPLHDAVAAVVGRKTAAVQTWNVGARPRDFASLAPLVFETADTSWSAQLLTRAATEIAALGTELGAADVTLAGGLGPRLAPWVSLQTPGITWHTAPVDPLEGLKLLAFGAAPDEALLPRF